MASLTLRLVKGSPLTNAEFDANFSNLNTDVLSRLLASSNLADLTNAGTARTNLGLGSVENKSSATIRGEISSLNVTTALGFTPYNATNPSGYITNAALASYLTSSTAASTYQPVDGDLTAIAALAGTAGLLKKTAANTWVLDTSTYLTSITSGQVTTALGFTPYNATNPSGYITSSALSPYLTSATAASTYQAILVSGTSIKTVNGTSVLGSGNIQIDGGVTSFNTRTGAVTLGSGDVTTALGYTPVNPTAVGSTIQGYDADLAAIAALAGTSGILRKTAADTWALDTATYLTGINSSQVTTALGFTPYNATNPSGFITSAALSPYLTSALAASTYQPIGAYLTGINSGQVTTALGFTPANKAGDTFTGAVLTSNAGGFTANSAAKLWTDSSRGRLDLYESASQTKSLRVMNANGYGIMGMTSAEDLQLWTNGVARLTLGGASGITASTDITVANGTDSRINLQVSGFTESILSANATRVLLGSSNAIPLVFNTNGVTRLTLTGGGYITTGASEYVGIGAQAGTNNALRVARNLENGTTAFGVMSDGTFQSGVTGTGAQFRSVARTAAAAFTMTSLHHFQATQATLGDGSAITTQSGFVVDSTLTGAANNYAFHGNIPSGTGRYNLYMAGTAANYLAGALGVDGAITQGGNQVLHAGNYTSYSPSLTGSGASGTWGINVTGNAATATTSSFATTAQSANGLDSGLTYIVAGLTVSTASSSIVSNRTSSTSGQVGYNWSQGNSTLWRSFVDTSQTTLNWYNSVQVANVMTLTTGGALNTTGAITQNGNQVLHAGNVGTYAAPVSHTHSYLPLSGGTLTGNLALGVTAAAWDTFTPVIELPGGASLLGVTGQTVLSNNFYYGGGASKRIATGGAAQIAFGGAGSFFFMGAASGAADSAITWTTLMSINTVGDVSTYGALKQGNNQVLHAGNYTSYSPPLTGSGASGTWGISITGSAGSVATRTAVLADGASVTINAATTDIATQNNTQSAGLTINAPSGTPVNGQKVMLRVTSAIAQSIVWNAIFRGSTDLPLPTSLSGGGKEDYLGFIYDSSSSKWDLIAKNFGF